MAYGDYMHCSVCDVKAFYDANIDWECQYIARGDFGEPLSVTVLCDDCFKTHEIVVQPRTAKEPTT